MLAMTTRHRMDRNHVFVRTRALVVFGHMHSILVLETFLWLDVTCGGDRVANAVFRFAFEVP
jgi:hypothetical protein